MDKISKIKILFLVVIFLFWGCSSISYINENEQYFQNKMSNLLIEHDYKEALKVGKSALKRYPSSKDLIALYGITLFKVRNYDLANKVLEKVIANSPNFYDQINRNGNFDVFFYNTHSLIELGQFEKAKEYLYQKFKKSFLKPDFKAMMTLLEARLDYYEGNYQNIPKKLNEFTQYNDLKNKNEIFLTFCYILANTYYRVEKTTLSLEIINRMIELDTKNEYSKKIIALIDKIIYTGESNFLEMYNDQLIETYNALLRKAANKSERIKLLRRIYALDDNVLEIKSNLSEKDKKDYLSVLKIFTDKNSTKIIFGASDSIAYSYEYDGKNLKVTLDDKLVKSENNFLVPLEGSGLEEIRWEKEGAKTIFYIEPSGDYEMAFESVDDQFEVYNKIGDNHKLILSIYLPEESLDNQAGDDGLDQKKYTVVLDPGHGGDDSGAIGVKKDVKGELYNEKDVALLLCKNLKKYLEKKGFRVFLTRKTDYYLSLGERNRIAQNRNADLFISLHLNAAPKKYKKYFQTERFYGSELVVRKTIGKQQKFINMKKVSRNEWLKKRKKAIKDHKKLSGYLSDYIHKNLDYPFNKARTIKYVNLGIFSGLTIPHALIEAGFIINNKNLDYLLSKRGQNALFKGIYEGIEKFKEN